MTGLKGRAYSMYDYAQYSIGLLYGFLGKILQKENTQSLLLDDFFQQARLSCVSSAEVEGNMKMTQNTFCYSGSANWRGKSA